MYLLGLGSRLDLYLPYPHSLSILYIYLDEFEAHNMTMDQFAEDEVQYATINRSHNTLSQPVITEMKNKFQYEIQDSSSSEESDSDETETASSESTIAGGGADRDEDSEDEESDDNNEEDDTASIGSATSLLDFSDPNREEKVGEALKTGPANDTMSICSTDVTDIVQRQLEEFSNTLRRQIETDMQNYFRQNSSEFGSQGSLPASTPSKKKHMTNGYGTKRKV